MMLIRTGMMYTTVQQFDDTHESGTQSPKWTPVNGSHSSSETTAYRVVAGLSLCLLAIAALIANILLVWVIIKSSQLRTCTNAFIVSIASSDIIFAVFVILPAALFVNIGPSSPRSCLATGSFAMLTQSVTSLSLMMVSIDRCIAVTWPLRYNITVTNVTVTIMLLVVWLLGVLLAVMPIFGWGRFVYVTSFCALETPDSISYIIVQRALTIIIPGGVIAVTITSILRAAYNQRRVFAILPMPGLALAVSKQPALMYRRSTLSAMRTLFFILAMLALLWSPWLALDLTQQLRLLPRVETASTSTAVTYYLTFLSCILNPFVFLFNKKYKKRLGELLVTLRVKSRSIDVLERPISSRSTACTTLPSVSTVSLSSLRPPSRVLYIETRASTLQLPTFIKVNPATALCLNHDENDASVHPVLTHYDVPDIIVSSINDDGEHIIEQPMSTRRVSVCHGRPSLDGQLTIHVPRISLSTI